MIILDRRIEEGRVPFTCFEDLNYVKGYIGSECYFSDNAYDFSDLSVFDEGNDVHGNRYKGELKGMSTTDSPFIAFASEEEVISFKYCLPCDYVRRSGK